MDFVKDALPYLAIVGAVLGLYTLFSAYLSRRRIKATLYRETYELKQNPNANIRVDFHVINHGDKPTSLERIKINALTSEGDPISMDATITNTDLQLPPHQTVPVGAEAMSTASYLFTWYRRYRIIISRGGSAVIYKLNAQETYVSFFGYWWGYSMLRFFKRLSPKGLEISEKPGATKSLSACPDGQPKQDLKDTGTGRTAQPTILMCYMCGEGDAYPMATPQAVLNSGYRWYKCSYCQRKILSPL